MRCGFCERGSELVVRETPEAPVIEGFDDIKKALNKHIGRCVRSVDINPRNLSLTIRLDDDSEILLQADQHERNLDQWFITTPSGRSIGGKASGNWYYDENVRVQRSDREEDGDRAQDRRG